MKQSLNFALVLSFLLTACSSETATPIIPTETSIHLVPILTATFAPAPIETPIPPLESLAVTQESVGQFVNAMQNAGINVTAEQIVQQGLQIQTITGVDGKQYEIATAYLDPDPNQKGETLEGNYPLLMTVEGEWQKISGRRFADSIGMTSMTMIRRPKIAEELDSKYMALIKGQFNAITMSSGEADIRNVFKDFTTEDWRKILNNWDAIKKQLDSGKIPTGFKYYWTLADQIVKFAKENNMQVRSGGLIWGEDVIDSIKSGNFSKDELLKILEFTTKVRVIKYPEILQWEGATEILAKRYFDPQNNFWDQTVGDDGYVAATNWVKEANPQAEVYVVEDYMLEPDYSPRISGDFLGFADGLRQKGAKIDGIIVENNFWAYSPPNYDTMKTILSQYLEAGYKIGAPEMMVVTSPNWVLYESRRSTTQPANPEMAQAEIVYKTVLTYTELGIREFGWGSADDGTEWFTFIGKPEANATPFTESYEPKAAYYAYIRAMFDYLISKN